MITFFGQPKYSGNEVQKRIIGYELLMRVFKEGKWQTQTDFHQVSPEELEALALQVIGHVSKQVKIFSINLEDYQFVDPAFLEMLKDLKQKTATDLYIELTERSNHDVSQTELISFIQKYDQSGLKICVDDVGTGRNSRENIEKMRCFVTEFKFALQNFRPKEDSVTLLKELDYWYGLSKKYHKEFVIEGIETQNELSLILKKYPCTAIQGYFLGKPQAIS
ncbi:EAL domain-containing protein [Pediococcus siamensis]|uniref:EAL domain-containing protein n=1 Tax=Pediococcus siamensis TaxID=381829 RepID=UPI0039A29912